MALFLLNSYLLPTFSLPGLSPLCEELAYVLEAILTFLCVPILIVSLPSYPILSLSLIGALTNNFLHLPQLFAVGGDIGGGCVRHGLA
jgi:hypothetical protein